MPGFRYTHQNVVVVLAVNIIVSFTTKVILATEEVTTYTLKVISATIISDLSYVSSPGCIRFI